MQDTTKINLHEAIKQVILDSERELDYTLQPGNLKFLQDTLVDTVTRSARKFIKGAIEHGDEFLTEVDHIEELYAEAIDCIMYARAAKLKYQQHDKRYDVS